MTWGDGEQPLQEHLQTLARHNYTGDISLELVPTATMTIRSLIWNGGFGCWKKPLAKSCDK